MSKIPQMSDNEIVAKTAYEAKRAFYQTQGDMAHPRWEHLSVEVQNKVLADVGARIEGFVPVIKAEERMKISETDYMAAVVYFSIISVMLATMGKIKAPVSEATEERSRPSEPVTSIPAPKSTPTGQGTASTGRPAPVVVQPAPNPPKGYAADPAGHADRLEAAGDVAGAARIREAEGIAPPGVHKTPEGGEVQVLGGEIVAKSEPGEKPLSEERTDGGDTVEALVVRD